jgi:hypothetical protein
VISVTPENYIKNQICAYLRFTRNFIFLHDSVGIYDPKINRFRKNTNRHRIRGVSDILGILKNTGRFLAIEVKVPGNKPTIYQTNFIENVRAHGGIAFVATSLEDVKSELKKFEETKNDN